MTLSEMVSAKLEALAANYLAKGYNVRLHPHRGDMPDFLQSHVVDLIATSPDDMVIVEVKAPRDFDFDEMQHTAEVVRLHKPWRYEIAMVNLPLAPDIPGIEEIAEDDQVNRLLRNAEFLASQDQREAAALIAWSAVEAILRRRARADAPEIERQSSARVLRHLYGLGRIQPDVYQTLSELLEFRNAFAHGFVPRAAPPDLQAVITDIQRLREAA